jgi:Asp-tRNA(Asn)/Glu-tRNA(Gln) amidotransferase A subunit family amidase
MPNNLTIAAASREIASGNLSPKTLLKACLDRIDALEDRIKAWAFLDREGAVAQAGRLEKELAGGTPRSPLHGIPIGIKDIMYVAGLPNTAGSSILKDFIPEFDATLVSRLRKAGAVILGKTITTPFACFDPAETCNPWNIGHTPGGSSSGSAAAVASGMCLAAMGSQTGGSITRPAAFCGIVGLKPTLGRVSVHGVVPVSFNLDHPGPLARSVEDAAIILQVIAGHDPSDSLSLSDPPLRYLPEPLSRPPRIGLIKEYFYAHADDSMTSATENAMALLRTGGAEFVEVDLPKSFDSLHQSHRTIMVCEGAAYHDDLFRQHKKEYPPGLRSLVEEGLAASAVTYAKARRHQIDYKLDIQSAFQNVDILLTPATRTPALATLDSTGDPAFNSPWSYAGLPTVSLPVELTPSGLPAAIQLVGPPLSEAPLLSTAHWCEKILGWNESPDLH